LDILKLLVQGESISAGDLAIAVTGLNVEPQDLMALADKLGLKK